MKRVLTAVLKRAIPHEAEKVVNIASVVHHSNHFWWLVHGSSVGRCVQIRVQAYMVDSVSNSRDHEATAKHDQIALVQLNKLPVGSHGNVVVPTVAVKSGVDVGDQENGPGD